LERVSIKYRRNDEIDSHTQKPVWRQIAAYPQLSRDWNHLSFQLGDGKILAQDTLSFRFCVQAQSGLREGVWLINHIKISSLAPPEPPSKLTLSLTDHFTSSTANWSSNPNGQTKFELGFVAKDSQGNVRFNPLAVTSSDVTNMDLILDPKDPKLQELRVRGCNGSLCSAHSEPATLQWFTTTKVYRYFRGHSQDYLFSTHPSDFKDRTSRFEGIAFALYDKDLPSRTPLYSCSADEGCHFLSKEASCEGKTVLGRIGYIALKASNEDAKTLYRCFRTLTSKTNHWRSLATTDPNECIKNGFTIEGELGYLP
jgi:hypothetical protein